jgi:segregation and condensation protein A
MIRFLQSRLSAVRSSSGVSASRLLQEQGSRHAMICLFLAILELVKRQMVALAQGEAFGEIEIRASQQSKKDDGTAEMSNADLAALESEYN